MHSRTRTTVRTADRWLDALALLTLAGGVLLFTLGRTSLTAIANETYAAPPRGSSWVERTELHDRQARWGMGIALAGVVLAAGAAMKHASAARRRIS